MSKQREKGQVGLEVSTWVSRKRRRMLTVTGNRWKNKFGRKDSAVGYMPVEILP